MTAAEVIATALSAKFAPAYQPYVCKDTAAIIEALKAAGYAVVELPKPDEHGEWFLSDAWCVWLDRRRRIQIRTQGYGLPKETRAFAAALLAGADAAEAVG